MKLNKNMLIGGAVVGVVGIGALLAIKKSKNMIDDDDTLLDYREEVDNDDAETAETDAENDWNDPTTFGDADLRKYIRSLVEEEFDNAIPNIVKNSKKFVPLITEIIDAEFARLVDVYDDEDDYDEEDDDDDNDEEDDDDDNEDYGKLIKPMFVAKDDDDELDIDEDDEDDEQSPVKVPTEIETKVIKKEIKSIIGENSDVDIDGLDPKGALLMLYRVKGLPAPEFIDDDDDEDDEEVDVDSVSKIDDDELTAIIFEKIFKPIVDKIGTDCNDIINSAIKYSIEDTKSGNNDYVKESDRYIKAVKEISLKDSKSKVKAKLLNLTDKYIDSISGRKKK